MSNEPHSVKTIGRSGFWSMSNQLVGQVLSLAVFLVTARFVSKEDFGIMATCMIAVEFFRQFLIESIGTTIYSRKSATDGEYNAGFYIIAVCGTVSAILTFLLAYPISNLFNHQEIAPTLQWISAILLTMGLSKMHEIWLTKNLQFRSLALRSFCSIALGGGIGVWMAVNGYGLLSLIAQQIITNVASLIWLWSASPWRPSRNVQWENVKSILNYWKLIAMNAVMGQVSLQSDIAFSSYYLGPAATGVYNAGKRMLAAMSMVVNGGLNNVALPVLASFSHEKTQFQRSFLACVLATTALTAPIYVGVAVLSGDVIHVLMGAKWAEVAPVLSVLTVWAFLNTLNPYSANILLIEGKAHWQTILGVFSAAANVGLLIVFARYGLTVLAMALALRVLLSTGVITVMALRILELKMSDYLRQVCPPIVFAMIMGAFIAYGRILVEWHAAVNLLVFVPAGAVVYLGLFYMFDRQNFSLGFNLVKQVFGRSKAA
jgi:O-antigen/teichoic acid export membrane protein